MKINALKMTKYACIALVSAFLVSGGSSATYAAKDAVVTAGNILNLSEELAMGPKKKKKVAVPICQSGTSGCPSNCSASTKEEACKTSTDANGKTCSCCSSYNGGTCPTLYTDPATSVAVEIDGANAKLNVLKSISKESLSLQ